MPKPEKQRSSGVSLMVDGVLAKRIQTVGVNADITREQTLELANAGVVQYISDAPDVSVTIDSNEVGSTDLTALITDQMINYSQSDEEDGARGGTYRHFIKASSSNAGYRSIDQNDLLNDYCSILVTGNQDGTAAAKSMYVNHAAVTGMNLSYDVGGNATENYTLTADNKTWFLNDNGAVRVYKPVFNQIVYTSTGIGFDGLGSCLPVDSTVVAIAFNNTVLFNRDRCGGVTGSFQPYAHRDFADGSTCSSVVDATVVGFWATSIALSTPFMSTASNSSDRCWIIYKPGGNLWEAEDDATDPGWELESGSGALGAIRRGYITPYLFNTNTGSTSNAGRALRLQNVSIDVSPGEEKLNELGTDGFYGVLKQTPIPVSVSIGANDSDLEYFAMMTSTSISHAAVTTLSAADFNGYNLLRVYVYQDKAKTTLLKTIEVRDMYPSSDNFNVSVGDLATHEMSFEADNLSIVGSGTNVVGGANNA